MTKKVQLLLLTTLTLLAPALRAQTVETVPGLTSLFEPYGIAVDNTDNNTYYITDGVNNRILKYLPQTQKASVIGLVFSPQGIAVVDRVGLGHGIVVADPGTHQILFINPTNFNSTVLAGSTIGYVDGPGATAKFASPAGLVATPDGTVYVADLQNNRVRRIANDAQATVSTVAAAVSFRRPGALAFDPNTGRLFVADTGNDSVKLIDTRNADALLSNLGGFHSPRGILFIGGEVPVLVADTGASVLRIAFGGSSGEIYAGAEDSPGSVNGNVAAARFNEPVGLALDAEGAILVADLKNDQIRRILRDRAVTPAILPPSGTYNNAIQLFVTNEVNGVVYFTDLATDKGAAPSLSSRRFVQGQTLNSGPEIIQLRSFNPDLLSSEISSNAYVFAVAPLKVTPAGVATNNTVQVTISSETIDTVIYWTIDNSTPSATNAAAHRLDNGGTLLLDRAGPFKAVGTKAGYLNSPIVTLDFDLVTADPAVLPKGGTFDNDTIVTAASATEGATIFYAVNQFPTPTSQSITNGGSFVLGQTGTLVMIAHRDGFKDSGIVTNDFTFKVATPTVEPAGFSSNNPVQVTLSSATTNAVLVWTIDGSKPSPVNGTQQANGSSFSLATNGTLRVIGFKNGYVASDEVTFVFNLKAANAVITVSPLKGTNINSATVTLESLTTGATFKYTVDGKTSPINGIVYTGPFQVTTNTTVQAVAFKDGFVASDVVSQDIAVQVDAPVMTPPGGFFQEGTTVTLTAQRPDAVIHYTTDGSIPTESSPVYTAPLQLNHINFPAVDLRQLRARAFAPLTLPSEVTSGSVASENTIGVSRDIKAGIGANVLFPVVISLRTNTPLESVQFRVQIFPITPGAPNLEPSAITVLPSATNDIVPIIGSQTTPTTNRWKAYQLGNVSGTQTNEAAILYLDTEAHLLLDDFGTIAVIGVRMPCNVKVGDQYAVRVVEPSATSDAFESRLPIQPSAPRTITIQNIPYVVGDASPSVWYNAGDFGDGDLDNADVNMALKASLGIVKVFANTDLFDAFDAWPLDEEGFAGGDGQIRLLDWQTTADRSLRLDPENWTREWSASCVRLPKRTTLVRAPIQARVLSRQSVSDEAPLWSSHALVESSDVPNAQSGKSVDVPVYINVKEGKTLTGLEFRAVIQTTGPDLTAPAQFIPSSRLPASYPVPGLPFNEVAYVCDLDSGLSLQGRVLLGQIHFTLPPSSAPGQFYRVRFAIADAAQNRQTAATIETIAGAVWVGGPAQANPFGRLSDEWRQKFFGSLDNLLSVPDADPDGDGVPNSEEYSKGTNPAKLRFHNLRNEWKNAANGFKLRFFAAPGQVYVIESAPDAAGPWTEIARFTGDGTIKEKIESNALGHAHFYRIRALDPSEQ